MEKIKLIATIATYIPLHTDINKVRYELDVLTSGIDSNLSNLIEQLYRSNLASFQSYSGTDKITLNLEDLQKLIASHYSYANDISQVTGRWYQEVLVDFGECHKTKKFLIQPQGFSGILDKASNIIYLSGAAVHSTLATASSHISGITGFSLLGASPSLVIFVPLMGGVFFGSLERLAANSTFQPALILARDACLMTPKIAEIAYNDIFVGPFLRLAGIDAPLNVTFILRFGAGTKIILGSVRNATITSIGKASPLTAPYF